MTGVLINTIAVILGPIIGTLIKKLLNEDVKKVVMDAMGLAVLCVGITDALKTESVLGLVLSLAIGGAVGALLKIQHGLDKMGEYLQNKAGSGDNKIAEGFVNATLITCVGAMAIYGSIQSGLGNHTTLLVKSAMDFVVTMTLSASLGWGAALCSIPLFILQGVFALFASFLEPVATPEFLNQLSGIGGAIVMGIGINLLGLKKIPVANLIPAILGAVFMLIY